LLRFLAIVLAAVTLAGCGSTPMREQTTLGGTAIGAGIGAAIGSATGGPPGAWAGAAIGGAAGGIVGYLIQPEGCFYRNRRGEWWQVSCEGKFEAKAACFTGNDIFGFHEVPCPGRTVVSARIK
jgi:osmotically inducible lipoprotein OsmB